MSGDVISEFVAAAHHSGILSADAASKLTAELHGITTRQDVAAKLVERGAITAFQAAKLLAGMGEECVLAGRYLILQQLGAGAMGAVYLAEDRKLDRHVAVKVLPAQSVADPHAVARFRREAKALAKLSHPNIIQAYDSDEEVGRYFLVMEYFPGTNLAEVLRAKGPIAPATAADYIYQAALGLQSAHEKGLVHRDLKPGNLLVTPNGQVKVLDLGLARFLQDHVGDATLTRAGTGLGTPDYMAPEQFHNAHQVDFRSDIYSLGCTLYHLITGRVPFPGTSISEKYAAHERDEPAPIEGFCPDAPAGLVLAVGRMMSKRPSDRFQSAREASEALAPYVASSSQSLPQFRRTTTWHGSQLSFTVSPARRFARSWSLGAAIAVILMLGVYFGSALFEAVGHNSDNQSKSTKQKKVVTISNGFTVAKDGTGQFKTILDALAKVDKPDMRIEVLDSATYPDHLVIGAKVQHDGLTLISKRRATIAVTRSGAPGILIRNTLRVTLCGFRVRMDAANTQGVAVTGASAGALLEDLECVAQGNLSQVQAITIGNLPLGAEDIPVTVRGCKIIGVANGIVVMGMYVNDKRPDPCRRIVISENDISNGFWGAVLTGLVGDVQITGNRIWNCDRGIYAFELLEGSNNILIANNSVQRSGMCIGFDRIPHGLQGIELRNNLILADHGPDLAIMDADQTLLSSWKIDHNWRLLQPPGLDDPGAKEWIPASLDHVGPVPLESLEADHPQFLRPGKGSSLATEGAGGDLPAYIGAVPPDGVAAWDWKTSWEQRHPRMVLTVSKDAKDGGEFRSINEALEKVIRPGMTIRVLDSATYTEDISLSKATVHTGLTLESIHAATIESSKKATLYIQDAPHVKVIGFRLKPKGAAAIVVAGKLEGLVLDSLQLKGIGQLPTGPTDPSMYGIAIEGAEISDEQDPVVVQNCTVQDFGFGIRVSGIYDDYRTPRLGRRVIIRTNAVQDCVCGVQVTGAVQDVQVVGNRVTSSSMVAIQLEALLDGAEDVLIANNTVFDSKCALRVWDESARGENIEVSNNLVVGRINDPDMVFIDSGGNPGNARGPGDGATILKGWKWRNNWREVQRPTGADLFSLSWIPQGKSDAIRDDIPLASRNANSADFLRPVVDSELANGGAGKDDPSLPPYIGAVPPTDMKPWDWQETWEKRHEK